MDNIVLSIDASPEPRLVAIHGTRYPLRSRDDLSIGQSMRYDKAIAELPPLVTLLRDGAELTDAQDEQVTALVHQLSALALAAPAAVVERLTLEQRMQIVMVAFFGATAPPAPAAAARRPRRPARRQARR